jgi:hypothetical protein
METENLARASEELLAHCAPDVVFEPYAAQGQEIRGQDELRKFWERFESNGRQMRAGAYSVTEEGDAVRVSGWVRTIKDGRVSARVERG